MKCQNFGERQQKIGLQTTNKIENPPIYYRQSKIKRLLFYAINPYNYIIKKLEDLTI